MIDARRAPRLVAVAFPQEIRTRSPRAGERVAAAVAEHADPGALGTVAEVARGELASQVCDQVGQGVSEERG